MTEQSSYIKFLAWLQIVKYTFYMVSFILLALLVGVMIG